MAKGSIIAGQLSGNKEINKAVTLSASIAHELKNYLAGISMYAELSENGLENIKEKIKVIRNRVKDADYLVAGAKLTR